MAAGAARERLRTWFAGQVQARSDGFLVRPLGRLGGVVVLPDEAAVSRYLTRRVALAQQQLAGRCIYATFMFAALATTYLDFKLAQSVLGSTTRFAVTLAAIVSVLIGAPWLARWQIYRWARRVGREVPGERWHGDPPSERLPTAVLPGWFIVSFVAVAGFGATAVFGIAAWAFSHTSHGTSLHPAIWLGGALTLGGCRILVFAVVRQWWRANGRAGRPSGSGHAG